MCVVPLFFTCPGGEETGLKVGEAAGVFFVLAGDGEDGLLELVVAELLEGDGGGDGGEHGDVCGAGGAHEGHVTLRFPTF